MNIGIILYTLLLKPLELLFEVIYYNADRLLKNPGWAIVVLSLVMNLLALPLYRRADKLQDEERETTEKLKAGVSHIKKTFRGNERFYMLQTYYRQNGYKPVYALRAVIPLLLEIPFFIAAYRFLSGLESIKHVQLGPIADLGAPDALMTIGDAHVNILPILMTVVNIYSGKIYSEKHSLKEKLQLYVTAAVFLVLLYRSPSALTFYWLLNNLFSLLKNIYDKKLKPGRVKALKSKNTAVEKDAKSYELIFHATGLFLTVLTGMLIPGNVIVSSVSEFVEVDLPHSPGVYIWMTLLLSAGFFLIWFGIYFLLASHNGKRIMALAAFILAVVGTVDYMAFNLRQGTLSELLQFDRTPVYSPKDHVINSVVIIILMILCVLIFVRSKKTVRLLLLAGVLSVSILGIKNVIKIGHDYKMMKPAIEKANRTPTLSFSRTGKNVVVLMMDAMISRYVPYMITDRPELKEMFDGFTFYPNTVSFGPCTNFGSPGLYGGYEYTPGEMNERDTELLVDKHNEALKVMPVIFSENDYKVTVCDPTYAGYDDIPDLSIYDAYPGIDAYITMGKFGQSSLGYERLDELRNRNFFMYGLFKLSPSVLQLSLYDDGNYCSTRDFGVKDGELSPIGQVMETLSVSKGVNYNFMKQYSVMQSLPGITEGTDDDTDRFFMMSNSLPHNPMLVREPEYEPAYEVDNTEYDRSHHIKYKEDGTSKDFYDENNYPRYHVNMASMLKLGAWFDKLRECGVWDNTRIIIVSDHAWRVGDVGEMVKYYGFEVDRNTPRNKDEADFSVLNCTLMVKDFDAKGFTADDSFMTNADTPALAFRDLIQDPVNPFTGKNIDDTYKQNNRLELFMGRNYSVYTNNGYKFEPDHWFSVHDNIFDPDNWEYLGFY